MAGLLLAGGVLLGFPGQTAVASTAVTSAEAHLPTKKPKPKPPPVIVVGTKEGAKAGARKKADGRLDVDRRNDAPKRSPGKTVSASKPHQSSYHPADEVTTRGDLRLNTGICAAAEVEGKVLGPNRCQMSRRPLGPTETALVTRLPDPADVTWEQVVSEYKDVLFPKLSVKVQPVGRTLVNLETIVYTDQSKVSTRTVTLLGFPVVVEATPMSYTWSFGDGASVTTTTPGRPYPAKDIIHKYMKKGGVSLTLTTNYAARFNVAGTGWQYIDGTVPITGPATALQVREAVPVLVEPGR
jgi:hypothetical protein